jgi:hypothetical protein
MADSDNPDSHQRFIRCSVCPNLWIPYTPGEGTLLPLWDEHKRLCHPEPKLHVTYSDGSKAGAVGPGGRDLRV